ncbi:transposable element Tcb2 transposase [Trichonephila clavipes]|nr:transposable element Tcb2 transposase [Trichonephila clavipes]
MYGSTCADMPVDVMGECLSSIKQVVGTRSECFYPRSNHWEVEGRPQCDKCGCRVRNCSQHRFTTLETISNYTNSYPGFSSGRPRGTTPADDRYIILQARRNRWQTTGENARHMKQATGRPISRFTVARRLHGGDLFARRPVRCVPLTPAHRRRRSLWCREHRNWRDNEWGRVLFTDESRFSLSSDSHRYSSGESGEAAIIPRTSLKGTGMEVAVFSFGEASCLGAMGLQFLFMDDNAPCHRTVAAEQLLESEDIERMDWPTRSPDLNPIEHIWDFLGRRLAARTLPPVTIRELRLALQDEWAAMPQQLFDTLILSMGRRCETCLATARGRRVKSTTPAEDRYIVLSAKRNRRTTAQQVVNQFLAASGKQISRKTVAKRLRGGGLYVRRPVVCVPLTDRTARLQWCREHHDWTEQDWACVLFSDESRFSLSSDCRRQLIWRESGAAYRPENIQEKDRYPTCSIMVWAGIMINGRGRLHVVANGTMTGQRFIDEVLLPRVRLFRGAVVDKFVFMDDNATCHRTLADQDYLDSEGIQRLV